MKPIPDDVSSYNSFIDFSSLYMNTNAFECLLEDNNKAFLENLFLVL